MIYRKTKIKYKIIILLVVAISFYIFCWWSNNGLMVTEIEYKNIKIPKEFSGYKILQLSDLHNKEFGENQKKLIKKIRKVNPDIIIMTGDMIDNYNEDITPTISLIREAVNIAPCYFVTGNHEVDINNYETFKDKIEKYGVIVLDSKIVEINRGNRTIELLGLKDANFITADEYKYGDPIQSDLDNLTIGDSDFKILLAHRPEYFNWYSEANSKIDLVFSGHAHGGQVRIPFINQGIVAPGQGIFPELSEGITTKNNTSIIVSRGLGNSIIPLRLFNRPEIVVVTLKN